MKPYFPESRTKADPDSLVGRIERRVDQSKSATTEWTDKQEKYYKMRMRVKKDKSFPFKGSSNLRMPTVDTYLRKAKSGIMNIVFGLRPIIQAVPTPGGNTETANRVEKFYDHLIMDVMNFKNKATIIVDQALEKGLYLAKPYWRQEIVDRTQTVKVEEIDPQELAIIMQAPVEQILPVAAERFGADMGEPVRENNTAVIVKAIGSIKSGEKKVTFTLKDVVYNAPDVAIISPEKVYVPTHAGFHPTAADYIVHEYYLSLADMELRANERGWDKKAVEEIKELKRVDSKDDSIDLTKDTREGITLLQESGLCKIREFYGLEDIGNGKDEMVCVTYSPSFNKELRKIKWNMYSGKKPFIKFFYELSDDRWFSHRGIPELLEDIVKEIDTQHNIKIDQQTIRNAPMFVYRAGMVNPNMVQMRPNQAIPVKGTMALQDAVQALNFHNPSVEYSYEREQQLLESKAQELLGQPDYSLQSQINRREPRTLGEVQMQASSYSNIFGLDAAMFTDSFTELFNMILELWSMYGPEEYEFTYFGQEGPESVKLSREEIQNKYKIVVRGNDSNSNPNVRLQKAQQVIMAITNPVFIQAGIVGTPQQMEGLKEFFRAIDISNYERFINPQPQPLGQQPPPPAALIKPKFEELTDDEQAQVIASAGVKPDMAMRGYDQERRVAKDEMDIAKQIVETMS
jgi:hypothetical protein